MTASEEPVPARPRRLSPLTPLVRAPLVLVAFVGASWQQLFQEGREGQGIGRIGLLLAALLVAGAVYGTVSWLRTTYVITGEELRIDTGVVARQSRRIRIDRLQGVDILQPLVARLVGLAELRLDVAGGDREGRLAYLPRREAEQLRAVLLVRRDALVGAEPEPTAGPTTGPTTGPTGPTTGPSGPTVARPERLVARLDLGRLLGSLVLSSESLFLAGAAVALVVVSLMTGELALTGGLVPAALGSALSLGRKLTGYYGFTLTESAEGLQVRRGLTALSSQTVALERVQGVVVREPLLWRPLGWARLDVAVAGNLAGDTGKAEASSTLMPVAPLGEVLALARTVLRGRDLAAVPVAPPPRRARWVAPLTGWTLAAGQDDRLLVARRGFWVRRVDAVPQERTQSVQLTQGPLQRRLGLADVGVDSPPGPVNVVAAHRDAADARRFLEEAVNRSRAARARAAAPVKPVGAL